MASSGRWVGFLTFAMAISSAQGKVSFALPTLIEETLLTTAKLDFEGNKEGLEAAARWTGDRLYAADAKGAHLACADNDRRREAVSVLHSSLIPGAVIRSVSSTETHGACFLVTCSHAESEALLSQSFKWNSFGPFPSALKVAPEVLEHNGCNDGISDGRRLCTTHGASMRLDTVRGLTVELSPGTLPDHDPQAYLFIDELLNDLSSGALDLSATNFWSDPAHQRAEHLDNPSGALRGREWSRAATVIHELSESAGETSPSDICLFGDVGVHHAAQDVLLVSGDLFTSLYTLYKLHCLL